MGKVILWVFSFPAFLIGLSWLAQKAKVSFYYETAYCFSQQHVAGLIATCQYPISYGLGIVCAVWVLFGIWLFRD